MRIIFHGANAHAFAEGVTSRLGDDAAVTLLPDRIETASDRAAYENAEVIISPRLDATMPEPRALRLLQVPGAGYDGVDMSRIPAGAVVCNCFGHEQPIAEYVMAAVLSHRVPLHDADQRLRQGDWRYQAGGAPDPLHGEVCDSVIGLLGFGHIGRAIAARAKAFEMIVHVANRSAIPLSPLVDRAFTLDQLDAFWGSADFIVTSVPLTESTTGIVGAAAFAAMRPGAVLINVGRGPTVDAQAMYDALKAKRIGGAVIDTWYRYPNAADRNPQPAALPFNELPNITMTPHMSGWTDGTIRRRERMIADNILRLGRGEPCVDVVGRGVEAA